VDGKRGRPWRGEVLPEIEPRLLVKHQRGCIERAEPERAMTARSERVERQIRREAATAWVSERVRRECGHTTEGGDVTLGVSP
jgi:hypothetical protein